MAIVNVILCTVLSLCSLGCGKSEVARAQDAYKAAKHAAEKAERVMANLDKINGGKPYPRGMPPGLKAAVILAGRESARVKVAHVRAAEAMVGMGRAVQAGEYRQSVLEQWARRTERASKEATDALANVEMAVAEAVRLAKGERDEE